jgi:hypothetical protein
MIFPRSCKSAVEPRRMVIDDMISFSGQAPR